MILLTCASMLVRQAIRDALKPPEKITVTEWCEKHKVLDQDASAEPGKYRVSRTPYMKEILDCLSAGHPARKVVFKKSSQVGSSEGGFGWLGYLIHQSPGPIMMVQPSVDLAERASKQRIAPMIENSPALRELVKEARSRDSGNTILMKKFPGGVLVMSGANSAAGLKQMPVKFLFLDELDEYPRDVDGQGTASDLAIARTRTFRRKKIFMCSTPTYKGASEIDDEFQNSDQRYYHVPCPHCNHMQHLKWPQLKWKKKPDGKIDFDSVLYECESCNTGIKEHHKPWMFDLSRAKWIAKNPGNSTAGFHINTLYSPLGWHSWADMVKEFYDSKDDPNKLKTFVNTQLGETFEIKGEDTPEWRPLYERRETYKLSTIPQRALLLTAGCDVQKDRIEVTVIGWNRDESWIVDHIVLYGDTSLSEDQKNSPWPKLDDLLDKPFLHESGVSLKITSLGIDSGYNTKYVYKWAKKHPRSRVYVLKGTDDQTMPISRPKATVVKKNGKTVKTGNVIWKVGSSFIKQDIYGRLKSPKPTTEELEHTGYPGNYVHFPELAEEYFKQLVSEQFVLSKSKTGHAKYVWVKTYPNNETLDCFVYNIAVYFANGYERWSETKWLQLEAALGVKSKPKPIRELPKSGREPSPQKPRPQPRRRDSSFWRR